MTTDLRIIFMGTPEFAVTALDGLLGEKYNIVGVITAADKPAGRGRKIRQSAVKNFAMEHNLNVLQPVNLKDPIFLEKLKDLKADLQIVVAFRMLPKVVWAMPRLGTFNLHASLLPEYRGAAPINWAIINGETKTGVTTFFINEKIDTGSILLQEQTDISATMDVGELHDELMVLGSKLILKTIKLLQSPNYELLDQPMTERKIAPKLYKENCKIDWTDSIQNIYNQIRGLSPYPGAWSILSNKNEKIEVKIYRSEKKIERHNLSYGTIISNKKEIKIAARDGFLKILDLKLAGKRQMDARSLLNGYSFDEEAKML